MKYISTRGDQTERRFCEILLEGLAPDGGLYLPERYPKVDAKTLATWRRSCSTKPCWLRAQAWKIRPLTSSV